MLDPMFHIRKKGYLLKATCKEPPKLKMWLPITILSNIFGLERATMQNKIKNLGLFKKISQHRFLSIIHVSIDNIPIIDMVHFSKEIKHFKKPTYIR